MTHPPHMPTIPPAWEKPFADPVVHDAWDRLSRYLNREHASGKCIYPPPPLRFRALHGLTPDAVKVVILGQDPYHGPGQAEGLSFSVPIGQQIPPSLRNIYKELANDLGITPPTHGHLAHWAGQGVLLLNAVLSVEQGKADSHKGRGWEVITDAIIRHVAAQYGPTVFLLWGAKAQKKADHVRDVADGGCHLILRAAHPSPLSAHNGFFGCRHFSKANAFLTAHGRTPIDWALPEWI